MSERFTQIVKSLCWLIVGCVLITASAGQLASAEDPWIVDGGIGADGKPIYATAALLLDNGSGLAMTCTQPHQTTFTVLSPRSSRFSGNTEVVYKFDNGDDHTASWSDDQYGNLVVSKPIDFIKEMMGHHHLTVRANKANPLVFDLGDTSRAIGVILAECGF